MWRYLFYFLSKANQKRYGIIYVRKKKIPHKNIKVHIINEKK